jgi:2-amino-4-hydroxy-6-hydroxymethyldihydropteridine diphosphokinase
MSTHTAFIGLGSNLQSPEQQINSALTALEALPHCHGLSCSPWYSSAAIGPGEQPDYINAVARLETQLAPLALLAQLQKIENDHGRQRDIRWGARTLDLDLLLYDNVCMTTKELQLPHPEMLKRNFVLYPLRDIAPDLVLPNKQHIDSAAKALSMEGLKLITDN